MVFVTPVRFSGNVEYTMRAQSEDEAMESANALAAEDDFGELEDIDWETGAVSYDSQTDEYTVTVNVNGRIEFKIQATSNDEVMGKAEDMAAEADCGTMNDIEWEVKAPIYSFAEEV